ncbi:sarcosine oxidase subunit alpha family protein [Alsobacter sp. SYSU M60028]|uniref:Sarcosine oxidase subunit alpha family protein n=1 Tax=Alsobacter ponti TaxID=2962936 RepID=A0ABT1L7V1_9HYPH|nr:sarcosine oxidase subunit alpha family protein [Alsobacter ponti]MCP8937136.1 sarcosine oxidase subunit alpha family protein [Alsobacter ponti]
MNAPFRTEAGGRVDRARPLSFTFDGKSYPGFEGDTLASALLANGVHLVGRSFKYHRPRGLLSAGAEEPNALVGVGRGGRYTPNLRATQVELFDGLVAESQNRWPSLGFDVGEVNDLAPAGLLSAGFYYKTFMAPAGAWKSVFEPIIRKTAGLGVAPQEPDPDHYTHRHAFCDVLVVGAGAAGLAAALAAAGAGARVILADEQAELGGGLLSERGATIDGVEASAWAERTVAALRANPNVTLLTRAQCFGYYAQNFLGIVERLTDHASSPHPDLPRERMWKVRAKQVVLATGAIERPFCFPDNDRPGVMLASAARTYVNRYGVRPGSRALVFTADESGYAAALDLASAGLAVVCIAELRAQADGPGARAARAAGLAVHPSTVVTGVSGRLRVTGATLGAIGPDGRVTPGQTVACDLVLMAGGWTPAVHLFSQSRGKLRFDEERQVYLPGVSAQDERSAGACNGTFGIAASLAEGFAAGADAATKAGFAATAPATPDVKGEIVPAGGFHGAVPHHRDPQKVKAFVDFQNDVTAKDIKLAVREGMRSIEHVKRYTTNGMATDQGKTSNMQGLAIASDALGKPMPQVGLTTFRPPYTPVTFGAFAGHSRGLAFDPIRRTPTHDWAAAQGAVFEDVGMWKRAWFFPRRGEDMHAAVERECRQVRASVGIFDGSTLGKIEVVGPDAAEFMNRLYTNPWSKLEPGRCRYGLMLNEAGFVMDDGVIGRLAADRFHVTTTTGGAPRVLAHMEDYLQTEFTDLKVWLTSTTEQWAVIAVQGPNARKVLEPLVEGIDISAAAMPHMSLREGRICGVPTRLFRVSFTGELGFEVNVPADYGQAVWEAVWAEGQKHDMVAYGTESMHVLRAEKGYIIVGQETDGTVTPNDLGLDWAIGKAKPDFVGKRSLTRPDLVKADRKQLVGLLTEDPAVLLEEGAQVAAVATPVRGTPALGHVTSAYRSPAAGRSIAMALVAGGRARKGQTLYVPMANGAIAVTVTDPIFFDPKGERLDV